MILNSHVYFKGELVRKDLFHAGRIRERGRGIGKSVWMKRLRMKGKRVVKGSVTVGIRKREGKTCWEV